MMFEIMKCIHDDVADIDMPKDGFFTIQFNYGGIWFDLTHTLY